MVRPFFIPWTVLGVSLGFLAGCSLRPVKESRDPVFRTSASEQQVLLTLARRALGGETVSDEGLPTRSPGRIVDVVAVRVYAEGKRLQAVVADPGRVGEGILRAATQLRQEPQWAERPAEAWRVGLDLGRRRPGPGFRGEGLLRSRFEPGLEGLQIVTPCRTRWLFPVEWLAEGVTTREEVWAYLRRTAQGEDGPMAEWAFRRVDLLSLIEHPHTRQPQEIYRGLILGQTVTPASLVQAAVEGGQFLARLQRLDGRFWYEYYPLRNRYLHQEYNLVRHCGTAYALAQLYRRTGNEAFREVTERALGYLRRHIYWEKDRALVLFEDKVTLGAVALGLLAFTEHAAATGSTDHLETMRGLARCVQALQEGNGHFRSEYAFDPRAAVRRWDSAYYPGEAILALARFHRLTGEEEWLEVAQRGADYLIRGRDAGRTTDQLIQDHWLLMGLNDLHELTGRADYAAPARRLAEAILAAQYTAENTRYRDYVGGYSSSDPPRVTPAATRSEGLVAAYHLAARTGQPTQPYLEALRLAARFQLQLQFREDNSFLLPNPAAARGGFRSSWADDTVRIDYVQHNISSLLGLETILRAK